MKIGELEILEVYRIGQYDFTVKFGKRLVKIHDNMQDYTMENMDIKAFLTKYMQIADTIVLETGTHHKYLIEHDANYGELRFSEFDGEKAIIQDVDIYDSARIISEMIINENFVHGLKIPEEWL